MAERPLCPCEFLVPVAYNDGSEVEPEVMVLIVQVLNRQFGAWTQGGLCTGHWQGQTEQLIRFQVSVPEEDVPRLEAVVKAIGRKLGQKEMYFAVGPPSVDCVKIDPKNDPDINDYLR